MPTEPLPGLFSSKATSQACWPLGVADLEGGDIKPARFWRRPNKLANYQFDRSDFELLIKMFFAAFGLAGWVGPCLAQSVPELTTQQWQDDITALVSGLEQNHRQAWNFASRADVVKIADQAMRKAKDAEPYEMIVALQQIAAAIGDGHTFVATSDLYSRYPIELRWIEGRYYVARATAEHDQLLGLELVAIDGISTERAAQMMMKLVPRNENAWFEFARLSELLTLADPLTSLGITRELPKAEFTFAAPDGRKIQTVLKSQGPSTPLSLIAIGSAGDPIAAQKREGIEFRLLDDVAYLNFRTYESLADQGADIWAAIDRTAPRALIIDFRENGGGSLPAGRQHIVYPAWERSQFNRKGCLYVLTGPKTFSAAMTNVTDLYRETEAILVGEPVGARPDGYQENEWFTLPHSRLRVSAAQRQYRFGLGRKEAIFPDIVRYQTVKDFRKGRDTALNAALLLARGCDRLGSRAKGGV